MAEDDKKGISWGKLVVGAGLVAGAVAAAVYAPDVSAFAKDALEKASDYAAKGTQYIGSHIVGNVGNAGNIEVMSAENGTLIKVDPGSAGNGIVGWIGESATNKAIAGSLAGLGTAGLLALRPGRSVEEEIAAPLPDAGFAAREDMRAMQGLMKARMMAANPQFMAAAMQGQAIG